MTFSRTRPLLINNVRLLGVGEHHHLRDTSYFVIGLLLKSNTIISNVSELKYESDSRLRSNDILAWSLLLS
jgi:hypothetical protein